MQKFIEFSFPMLDKEHLSVLRALGRAVGVKAPAAKSKKDLIEDILSIQRGLLEPVGFTNKGAPPKIDMDLSRFFDKGEVSQNKPYTIKPREDTTVFVRDVDASTGIFEMEGVLEQNPSGYGFLRINPFQNSKDDVYVSPQNIRRYNIRSGDVVRCLAKLVRENDAPALQSVISVNGLEPDLFLKRASFDDLLAYYPVERLKLEKADQTNDLAVRFIDLFSPIGKGQRGLIVAPPKTGKTTLLKMIASSIEQNYQDVNLIVLLIDERPEEVTDIKRSISSEVIYSTFDESAEHHVKTAESVINRAKRMVEVGKDVVILLDSITRLARAYNNVVESSGKTLSGGLDPAALQGPKKFFGSARNIDGAGSLTIIATALVETGSRMDDVIFEEFKGTGNMEIHLSRNLSEKRVFPAIDLFKSGTRKEDLLLSKDELDTAYALRKVLSERNDATDGVIDIMNKTKDNLDLVSKLPAWLKLYQK